MSGHSRWSTIKRKKGAADQKRGREFSKMIRVITQAARAGGGDPDQNATLRSVVDKAKSINMPTDTIARAIKRGTGEIEGANYEEITYEGYGPSGIALLIATLTDNRNRTTADVRHALNKYGGALGEAGCVQWMFSKKGVILVPSEGVDEEKIMEVGIEAGAEEVLEEGDFFKLLCSPSDLEPLKKALSGAGYTIDNAEVSMEAQTTIDVSDKAESVLRLIDALEDLDDVQDVYSNFDIPDSVMEKLDA
ncbi:MAG TPA: YebC/PmpR family DNA-binding transcriptional regulator [bacterium]|nr:YebC/PmpR family DNA-binding transcriptional regulator [bacterium]